MTKNSADIVKTQNEWLRENGVDTPQHEEEVEEEIIIFKEEDSIIIMIQK